MSARVARLVGYARASATDDPDSLDLQVHELQAAGCAEVFTDQPAGRVGDRPALAQALEHLEEGDALVITELFRLGRYTAGVLELIDNLDKRGIGLHVLDLGLDTATPTGRQIVSVLSAVARLEIDLTRERVMAGLDTRRERGRIGRPPALNDLRRAHVINLAGSGMPVPQIAQLMSVTDSTIRRLLRAAGLTPQDRRRTSGGTSPRLPQLPDTGADLGPTSEQQASDVDGRSGGAEALAQHADPRT